MRPAAPVLIVLALLLAGCAAVPASPAASATATASPTVRPTQRPSETPTPEPTAIPTKITLILPTYPPTTTPRPRPTVITGTPGQPRAGMELIFADEFEGDALDETKWTRCYPWDEEGCTNSGNNELEWYLPENVEVADGLLRLRADARPVSGSDGKDYPYTSGMVTSFQRFDVTYGYFEMRARAPKGQGLWPAFWALPSSEEWPPEIDFLEILGHQTSIVYTTLHFKNSGGLHEGLGGSYETVDLAADFHVYACDWREDEIVWYVDGVQVYRVNTNIPQQPFYILANLAVGGNWPGSPDENTQFPAYFDIDYIRVYRD